MIHTIQLICILLLIGACGAPKPTTNEGTDTTAQGCNTLVQAKDFSHLDGCRVLLITPDQKKLFIGDSKVSNKINAGSTYKIGYEVIPDQMSSCMNEDAIVRLTCVEEIELGRPALRECYVKDNVMEVPFLKKIVDSQRVQRIVKHDFRDGAAYVVSTKMATEMFDCQGNNMCEEIKKEFRACFSFYKEDFGDSKIIFQGEGPQD